MVAPGAPLALDYDETRFGADINFNGTLIGDGGVIETFGVETLVFADRAFEVAAGPEAEGLSGPDPSAFAFLDLSSMQYFERGIDEDRRGFYEPRLEDGRLSEGEFAVALIGSEESMSLYEGIFTDGVIIDTDPALL